MKESPNSLHCIKKTRKINLRIKIPPIPGVDENLLEIVDVMLKTPNKCRFLEMNYWREQQNSLPLKLKIFVCKPSIVTILLIVQVEQEEHYHDTCNSLPFFWKNKPFHANQNMQLKKVSSPV